MPTTTDSLYDKTVQVTEEFLGPAGERFIRRQITTHLNIPPEDLDTGNLSKLIEWSSIAFALMTNNAKDIDSFKQELKSLAKQGE
ncbi:MAG TPA: hypothetical protein VF572_06520 [Candidatus Saccharimonadales bacterium]|jgi:hypothetical protein